MGQNQRDGGWQGESKEERNKIAYLPVQKATIKHRTERLQEQSRLRGDKHKESVLRAIDSHSGQGSYATEAGQSTTWSQKTEADPEWEAKEQNRSRSNRKRRTKSFGRRTHRIKLNKTAFPKRRTGKGEQRETDNKVLKGKAVGIKLAAAAACLLSLFFLGRGIGVVTQGTIPTAAKLLEQSDNWGLGFGAEGAQPTGNVSASELAQYGAWYVGDAKEKVIYLTFDAGYENGNTEPILDALKKHNAQATFFVVGHYLETAPELIKRMVAEGHTIGNHTWHHPDMSSISSKEAFSEEMKMVEEAYKELTGEDLVKFYRPPQGKYNLDNLKMAQELGYQTFFWSLAYVDWYQEKQPSHEEAFEKLTKRIHPGAIVLLHSTSKTNGEIFDELLTKWEEMGYTFRPLSELAEKSGSVSSSASTEAESQGNIDIYSGKQKETKGEGKGEDGGKVTQ